MSCWATSRFRFFDRMVRLEIGRYDFPSDGFRSGFFNNEVVNAALNCVGNTSQWQWPVEQLRQGWRQWSSKTEALFRNEVHVTYVLTDCTVDQFRCDNGQCTTVRSMCDGVNYCIDGSDQANCCEYTHTVRLLCDMEKWRNDISEQIRALFELSLYTVSQKRAHL